MAEAELPPFPVSLPGFQRLFPDEAACAAYLERCKWPEGFVCSHCGSAGEPFRFANRLGVLRCRACRKNTRLTVGTVIEGSHIPLQYMVLGRLSGYEPDAGHLCQAIPAPARSTRLRNRLPNPPQAAGRDGAPGSRPDRRATGIPRRSRRDTGGWTNPWERVRCP
jgi:hypothetical protein